MAHRPSPTAVIAGIAAIFLCVAGGVIIKLLGNGPLPVDAAWFDLSN